MGKVMTDDEKAAIDGKSWETFGARLGLTLYGWTFDRTASFSIEGVSELLYISKKQRETIEKTLGKIS